MLADKPVRVGAKVTLAEVAKAAGVSTATVSMALRGDSRITAATQQTVLDAASGLGYVYDRSAAYLRTGRSDTIGLVISDIANPFFAELATGVDIALEGSGKIVFLSSTREDLDRQWALLSRMREQHVDGILFCAAADSDPELLHTIDDWGLPCVQMLRYLSPSEGDYVAADYEAGIASVCRHLIALGHTRIAFIGGDLHHSATWLRHSGFRSVLRAHDLNPDLILPVPLTRHDGQDAIRQLLAMKQAPSAAVCYNDVVAFGVMNGLRQAGLGPGRDFAVTGFDNLEEAEDYLPGLTSVAADPRAIGRAAVRLLLQRFAAPEDPPQRIVLPTRLIVRGSCGAVPS